jgi:hypothetical protein
MATITIGCPSSGNNIVVTLGSGSCSGAVGTICVCGQYFVSPIIHPWLAVLLALFRAFIRWLKELFRPRAAVRSLTTGPFVRVRVLKGVVVLGQVGPPNPTTCWDVDVTPSGQFWHATGVQVPAYSASGAALTVVAWLLNSNGSIADGPHIAQFNGGGSGARDCCSGCSGSGTSPAARALAAHPPLHVAVPDGPNAGLHQARAVASYAWELIVRGVTYRLCCDCRGALVIQGPASSAPASSVEDRPFSATFPGSPLGAGGEVVVTVA